MAQLNVSLQTARRKVFSLMEPFKGSKRMVSRPLNSLMGRKISYFQMALVSESSQMEESEKPILTALMKLQLDNELNE